ncbi:hypothetical protein [Bradyrhizobium sp. RT9b]|uniref:hypothetical protein n=1 Tax=Bradyrhizobium sp. RT9b TaxID=3156385 RepID=UPI0033991DD1
MPFQQWSFAIDPKLMLKQNIAGVFDKWMSDLKIHDRCNVSPARKLVSPIVRFEFSHAEPAFRSHQSGALVS